MSEQTRPRRTRPLSARVDAPTPAAEISVQPPDEWSAALEQAAVPALPAPSANGDESEAGRYQRLANGVRQLRVGGATLNLSERTLMILGSVLAVLGLFAIFVGWYGAAHSPYLFQQVPYLISGGLFGVALVFLGSIFYFSHWLTELVKESRTQSAALVEAINRLEDTVRQQSAQDRQVLTEAVAPDVTTNGSRAYDLVATGKGTMAHRPDCVVVAGKRGLRRVDVAEALEPCKLCDPYAEVAPG